MRLRSLIDELYESPELTDEIRQLKIQVAMLMNHYEELKLKAGIDAASQYHYKVIYPIKLKLEKAEQDLEKFKLKQGVKGRSLEGFDTNMILYHGTNADFETFSRQFAKSAAHIYTSSDPEVSRKYGSHLYKLFGRQEPQADITAEDGNYELIQRVYEACNIHETYEMSLGDFVEHVHGGQLYQYRSSFQDMILSEIFLMGHRSIRMDDQVPGSFGGIGISIVFNDHNDLVIADKVLQR